jgi:TRAP-type C4-dicarboxylate transport system substrate-binding protein
MSGWGGRGYRPVMRARRAATAVVALLAVPIGLTTGCSERVSGPTLVLSIASPDEDDDDTAAPIKHFAAEVDRRSGGTIRIVPAWDVAPPGVLDWDQVAARSVVEGTYALGFVPARVMDLFGVDSLRALNAPFLVTSLDAERAVLEDGDLRADLMAGLPDAGLVGLDLMPDGLRHPFGYDHPVLGAADYEGLLVRTGQSATIDRLFETLGASGTTDDDAAEGLGVAEAQYSRDVQGAGIATSNVTFFPKVNALVAGRAVAERLRADQWDVLLDAADATRTWQSGHLPSDADAAASFCRDKGTIVTASADEVLGLEQRAAAVTEWLSEDPATRSILDRIAGLVADATPETPLSQCPTRTGGAGTGRVSSVLDGRYFFHVFRKDLVAAGVTNENDLRENSGRLWMTLRAGRWSFTSKANHYLANPEDDGSYEIAGDVFTFHWDEGDGDWTRMTFRIAEDGSVHFTDILDGHPEGQLLSEGWFGVPWTRLGKKPR